MPSQLQSYSGGKVRLSRRAFQGWLFVLVVLNLLVRLPLCGEPATVTPDGAEYLAIARSLREEGRYATDLKWQFFTDDPVRHPAWVDRPPLYPLYAVFCARVLPFLDPTTSARVGNVLLACLALVLGALYLRRLFGPVTALLAAGYFFLLPHTLYWTTQPLTEALALALSLAALLLWDHAREARKGSHCALLYFAAGAACGLAYLTRPTGLLLLVALLLDKDKDKDKDKEARIQRTFGAHGPELGTDGALEGKGSKASPSGHEAPTPTPSPSPLPPTVPPPVPSPPRPNPNLHPHRSGEGPSALRPAPRPPYPYLCHPALYPIAGFLLLALPYHLLLWHHTGSPFASALGFTYRIRTIHDVTVLGFERAVPSLLGFLQLHGAELPGLLLRQAASHAQGILLPLLGLLPFALGLRRADLAGSRRAPLIAVLLLIVTHTLTWSAKGSSRYFLLCLLLLAALLLHVGLRGVEGGEGKGEGEWGSDHDHEHEQNAAVPVSIVTQDGSQPSVLRPARQTLTLTPTPTPTLTCSSRSPSSFILHPSSFILLLTASVLGLAFELTRFYGAQLGPGGGAPEHVAWKAAAAQVQGARLIASDNPWSLNLLTERPTVILPRTTDPEKLERFIHQYQPDVLVLFPNEAAERPMAEAWRAGRLPLGWHLTHDGGDYLLVQPAPAR